MNPKRLIIDLDGTITKDDGDLEYRDKLPDPAVVARMREYKQSGFVIVIYTARNMRKYSNSIGLITAHTLPIIIEWLKTNEIPYDEIHIGKPWCGTGGFYVDDKAIRPNEFTSMSLNEISALLHASQRQR